MASSELLKQIQAGRKLKHADTNDRSAPLVDTPKSSGGSNLKGSSGSSSSAPLTSGGGLGGGAPQPGSLFAGGIPKLKSAGQSKHGTVVHFLYCLATQFNASTLKVILRNPRPFGN
jgi:WH2 motif